MNSNAKKILIPALAVLVFILVALPAVYDNSVFGYLPVIFLGLALLVSYVCMLIARKNIMVSSDFNGNQCYRGKSVTIDLNIANKGIVMCPRAAANVFISDIFGNSDTRLQTLMTLAPKTESSIGFDMDMPHIGVYNIGIDEMELSDFFGLFKNKVNIEGKFPVYVLPRIFPVENMINSEMIKDEAPKERSTAVVGGTDYMGTREYEPGDSIKNIHWKLSAKAVGFMTKVFESSREMDFTVILDFTSEKQDSKEISMDLYDTVIETGLSLINEISRTHASYYLVYANKSNIIKRVTPKGRDHDIALIKDFGVINDSPGPEDWDAYTILEDDNKMSTKTSNVIVVTSRITEDLVQELVKIKRQGRTPELYVVIPQGLTRREQDDYKGRLLRLDEANVYFNFVTTGMNY